MKGIGPSACGRRRGGARWTLPLLFCAAAMLAWARPAAGQTEDADSAAPQRAGEGRACFSGRPSPACRSFWITEFGGARYTVPPRGGRAVEQRELLFQWELGWMRNRSPSDAVGATVFFSTSDEGMRSGVRARYRRWLADGLAVDVAPSLILLQANGEYEVHTEPGASVLGALSFGDWIVLTSEVEATSGGVRVLTGARVGTYAGTVAGLGFPIFIIALLSDDS